MAAGRVPNRRGWGQTSDMVPAATTGVRPRAWPDRARLWAPVVAWAAVIFVLSSIPSLATGLGVWDLVLRKLAHAVEFAILGALLFRAIAREPAAIALGSLYAVTDEVHQVFVTGRDGSPLDWLIDTAGVVGGVLLLSRTRR